MSERMPFAAERGDLDRDIENMGARVEEAITRAAAALHSRDRKLARRVKIEDEKIDDLRNAINDKVAVIIATQQPVAKDLRSLISVFELTDNLERAADCAAHLAKAVKKFADEGQSKQIERLEEMANLGAGMVRGSVDAFLRQDVEKARRIASIDDQIDEQHKTLQREVIESLKSHPKQAEQAAKLLSTSGFLERLGDHMTNICAAAIFVVESRHIDLNE
jgi:phosphate transport system protein